MGLYPQLALWATLLLRRENTSGSQSVVGPINPQALNRYAYVLNNPVRYTDPTGHIAPLVALAVIWAAVEVGLTVVDAVNTALTVADPHVSTEEKVVTGVLFAAGVFLPGGGYSFLRKLARPLDIPNVVQKPGMRGVQFKGRFDRGKWYDHFERHGKQLGYNTADEYLKGAQQFISDGLNESKGVLHHVRENGEVIFFDPTTNAFAAIRADGYVKTYMLADDKLLYWLKEVFGLGKHGP